MLVGSWASESCPNETAFLSSRLRNKFQSGWDHIDRVIGTWVRRKITCRENPELETILADEFTWDGWIIKTLRLEILTVKERPRPPWLGGFIEIKATVLPYGGRGSSVQ